MSGARAGGAIFFGDASAGEETSLGEAAVGGKGCDGSFASATIFTVKMLWPLLISSPLASIAS
jgi:hypothetical protein